MIFRLFAKFEGFPLILDDSVVKYLDLLRRQKPK